MPHPNRLAYICLGTGLGLSIIVNVSHAHLTSRSPGALLVNGAPPVLLFLCIEALARSPRPVGRAGSWVRWGGTLIVAAVSALVSYEHMHGLLVAYGESPVVAALYPLAPDGLMAVGASALMARARETEAGAPVESVAVEVIHDTPPEAPEVAPVTVAAPEAPAITAPAPAVETAPADQVEPEPATETPTGHTPADGAIAPAVAARLQVAVPIVRELPPGTRKGDAARRLIAAYEEACLPVPTVKTAGRDYDKALALID